MAIELDTPSLTSLLTIVNPSMVNESAPDPLIAVGVPMMVVVFALGLRISNEDVYPPCMLTPSASVIVSV